MAGYNKGTDIKWDWGNGTAEGKITYIFTKKVTRTIKENEVTRRASSDEPVYMIEQSDGDRVVKGHSEVSQA